ncbi:MAG: hypothetical protein KDB00_21600 [Planctomycetales bacterium]|nr:hypothetical protein [Planctomycetales bacterium]
MASPKKSKSEKAQFIAFRLSRAYAEKLASLAEAANLTPNQISRIATMHMVNNGLLSLSERIEFVSDELIRLRRDFNDAVVNE